MHLHLFRIGTPPHFQVAFRYNHISRATVFIQRTITDVAEGNQSIILLFLPSLFALGSMRTKTKPGLPLESLFFLPQQWYLSLLVSQPASPAWFGHLAARHLTLKSISFETPIFSGTHAEALPTQTHLVSLWHPHSSRLRQ